MKLPSQRAEPFEKALKRSAIGHGLIVILFLVGPFFFGILHRRKPDIPITFIDLVAPSVSLPAPPEPEPEPEPAPEEPAPEPPAPEIPEVVKKPEVKKPEPPKTNLVVKSTIKISTNKVKRVASTPVKQKSPLTAEEIRKLIAAGMPQGGPPSSGQASEMSWYYALVRATMFEAWNQPGGLSGQNLQTMVTIRVERNGTITKRTMIKSSGNSLMDDSVMRAVNSVSKLKALPAEALGFYKEITINFVPEE